MTQVDNEHATYAEDGQIVMAFDPPGAYRRWGTEPDRFIESLRRHGFPIDDDDEKTGLAASLRLGELLTLVIQIFTGITLDEASFDDPWIGGLILDTPPD